jgi:hypothetical protein
MPSRLSAHLSRLARLLPLACLLAASLGPAPAAAAEAASAGDEIVLTLERTSCFGECPSYSLTLSGDGKVVYEGTRNVKVEGKREFTVDPERVRALARALEEIGFFSLPDEFATREVEVKDGSGRKVKVLASVSGLPAAITTLRIGGRSKTVRNYFMGPKELSDLELRIDELAGSKELWFKPAPLPPEKP